MQGGNVMSKWWDPSSISDEQLDKKVENGDIDDYKRTDIGGIQKYHNLANGNTLIKDDEPADNDKGHNTTEFTISGGYITNINPHPTNK